MDREMVEERKDGKKKETWQSLRHLTEQRYGHTYWNITLLGAQEASFAYLSEKKPNPSTLKERRRKKHWELSSYYSIIII